MGIGLASQQEHDDLSAAIGGPAGDGRGTEDPGDEKPEVKLTVEQMLGRAVLRLRLYWGWSQTELERRSGVDQTTISRFESGRQRGLSLRRLAAILRALRVGSIDLMPPDPIVQPTALELMLYGNRWERAVEAADRQLSRRRSA